MLETAIWGTYYNVQINLSDVKDEEFKKKVQIIEPDRQTFESKIEIIFLFICLNACFGCPKEPSHFEHPQHVVWMRNKKFKWCFADGPIMAHFKW